MTKVKGWLHGTRRFARSNRAVSALEYAILVGVIAVGMGAAMLAFNNQVKDALQAVQTNVAGLQGVSPTPAPTT